MACWSWKQSTKLSQSVRVAARLLAFDQCLCVLVCVLTLWMPSSLTQTLLNMVLKTLQSARAKKRTVLSCILWAISSKMTPASSWSSSEALPVSWETCAITPLELSLGPIRLPSCAVLFFLSFYNWICSFTIRLWGAVKSYSVRRPRWNWIEMENTTSYCGEKRKLNYTLQMHRYHFFAERVEYKYFLFSTNQYQYLIRPLHVTELLRFFFSTSILTKFISMFFKNMVTVRSSTAVQT